MPDFRPDMSRLYHNFTTRLGSSFQSVNSSVRSFGHTCRNHITRFQQNSSSSNNNSSNPFLDTNNENDRSNQSPLPGDTSTIPTNTTNSSNIPNSQRSSIHQRSSCRSSSRGHHRYSSCRDREYRNAYHLYRNGLISVRTLDKDRNVLAAVLSIIVIAVLATALAQPKWFSIYNDLCAPRYFIKSDTTGSSEKVSNNNDETPSIFDFQTNQYTQFRPQYYYNGPFHSVYSSSYALAPVTIYGLTPDYKSCANPQILALKRTIIALCFLAIMCTLVQFFMDTMGTQRKWVNSMRIYAVGNIICVLLCILVIGLCYFISVLYERVQLQQLFSKTLPVGPSAIWIKSRMISRSLASNQLDYLTINQIEVKFELSYYLVTLAGFLSILASAANLFRRPRQIFIERISEVNNCRSQQILTSAANNGDENSLLGSDALNNTGAESPTNQYLPQYAYLPNDWLFNPNWSLFYNPTTPTHSSNHHHSNTNHNHHIGRQHSSSNNNRMVVPNLAPAIVPPPPVPTPCPPPPPYSP